MDEVNELIEEIDEDEDGEVDFDEFRVIVAKTWAVYSFQNKLMANMQGMDLMGDDNDNDEIDDEKDVSEEYYKNGYKGIKNEMDKLQEEYAGKVQQLENEIMEMTSRLNEQEMNIKRDMNAEMNDEEMKILFDEFDEDGGGTIDAVELQNALKSVGEELSMEEVKELIQHVDGNEDGEIDFDEFKIMVNQKWFADAFQSKLTGKNKQEFQNDVDEEYHQMELKEIKKKRQEERKQCNDTNTKLKQKSLIQFDSTNICDKIKWWIYNDEMYEKYLWKTIDILWKHKRSINNPETVKIILQKELLSFVSEDTLNIMIESFGHQKDEMYSTSVVDIGYKLYNFPMVKLLNRIQKKNEPIDGRQFLEYYIQRNLFIKEETGWLSDEIYQVETVLFSHYTAQSQEIIIKNTSLSNKVLHEIQVALVEDEMLCLKIKNNENIQDFSEKLMNIVHELTEQNEENKVTNKNDAYFDDDFEKQIYEIIAEFFSSDGHTLKKKGKKRNEIILDRGKEWICSNCSNYNFCYYIDSKMSMDLSVCKLCGIPQKESILVALKNYDNFVMANDNDFEKTKQQKHNIMNPVIDEALGQELFVLSCPNRSHNMECPSFRRLAQTLIEHNKWLHNVYNQTGGNDNIDQTVQVEAAKYIDNKKFREIFIESCRSIAGNKTELATLCDNTWSDALFMFMKNGLSSSYDLDVLCKFLDDEEYDSYAIVHDLDDMNASNIIDETKNAETSLISLIEQYLSFSETKTFLKSNRKTFSKILAKYLNIKPAAAAKMHKRI
eukprot:295741_1